MSEPGITVTPAENPEIAIQTFFLSSNKIRFDYDDDNDDGMFERALAKLGPLTEEQLYGFEPTLVSGGEAKLENLVKLRMNGFKLEEQLTVPSLMRTNNTATQHSLHVRR